MIYNMWKFTAKDEGNFVLSSSLEADRNSTTIYVRATVTR